MSVNYESALIYGCDCSQIMDELPEDFKEQMENYGFDIIYDGYGDKFLYVGKFITHTDLGEDARVDCLAHLDQAQIDFKSLLKELPWDLHKHLPYYKSIYHICYAT